MPICTNLELLENLEEDVQVINVTLDNTKTALMIFSYAESLKYLQKDVIVTTRRDMYKGLIRDFIATITEPVTVNTFERNDNVKLFCDATDSYSNVCFSDIEDGDVSLSAILYCTDIRFDSSAKASWADLTVSDKARKIAHLRLFDPNMRNNNMKGKYVKCDLRRNSYGFSAQVITPMAGRFAVNPEINIAHKFITDSFASDKEFLDFIYSSGLFEYMNKHIDYEPGFIAVRTAIELDIAKELSNVMVEADMQIVMQAIVASKVFVKNTESLYCKSIVNVVLMQPYKFAKKKETLLLLDEHSSSISPERILYTKVLDLADSIVKIKKGQS